MGGEISPGLDCSVEFPCGSQPSLIVAKSLLLSVHPSAESVGPYSFLTTCLKEKNNDNYTNV